MQITRFLPPCWSSQTCASDFTTASPRREMGRRLLAFLEGAYRTFPLRNGEAEPLDLGLTEWSGALSSPFRCNFSTFGQTGWPRPHVVRSTKWACLVSIAEPRRCPKPSLFVAVVRPCPRDIPLRPLGQGVAAPHSLRGKAPHSCNTSGGDSKRNGYKSNAGGLWAGGGGGEGAAAALAGAAGRPGSGCAHRGRWERAGLVGG